MMPNTFKSLVISAVVLTFGHLLSTATVASAGVSCHPRNGYTKIKWHDPSNNSYGWLGLNNRGQFELRGAKDEHPAYVQFQVCNSNYIGASQKNGFLSGHFTTLGKCLSIRSGALHLDPCPMNDDSSQTASTFGVLESDNTISAAAGDFTVAAKNGIQLYVG